ncbi:hypothetical protein V6B08_20200 [Ferrovibrio sp. MS7]|uniref:hypothetical protein n=1 Tax=Ferrovibrio plantarum TaxID=3119164 RepID=UPI0031367A51
MSPSDTATIPNNDNDAAERRRRAVAILAKARAESMQLGVDPADLGNMFLDEAMLAWLIAEWPERDMRKRLMEAMMDDVKKWYSRARVATGQCDCVQEVHLAGMIEAEALEQGEPPVRLVPRGAA